MKILKFFALLFVTPLVFADYSKVIKDTNDQLIVEIEQSYILGDGDTKIDARNIALQHAKVKAAEMAGSYVKSERIIKDDEIKSETIKTVSTALMQTKIKNERFSITKSDQMQITLVVSAELDKRSILDKLGLLKKDSQKRKQMDQIQQENSRLQKELGALNRELAKLKQSQQSGSVHAKPRQELVKRRDEIFAEIEQNENSISAIFKKGTLFAMAKKSSSDLDYAKKDITTNIWGYIVNNTKITLGKPDFQDNGNGTYDIRVEVKWSMNGKTILDTINKYFRDYGGSGFSNKNVDFSDHMGTSVPGVKIKKYYNSNEDQLKAYTYELYKFLLTKQANIIVSADRYRSIITIATSRSCSVRCGSRTGDSQYQIHFNNMDKPKEVIFGENPVRIRNVPQQVLENLTSIDAKVVLK